MTRSSSSSDPQPAPLQPAGRRWGFGAHTVMPYLAHSGPAREAGPVDTDHIRNPVFPHMENALRAMRRGH